MRIEKYIVALYKCIWSLPSFSTRKPMVFLQDLPVQNYQLLEMTVQIREVRHEIRAQYANLLLGSHIFSLHFSSFSKCNNASTLPSVVFFFFSFLEMANIQYLIFGHSEATKTTDGQYIWHTCAARGS